MRFADPSIRKTMVVSIVPMKFDHPINQIE